MDSIPKDILQGWQVLVVDDDPKSLDIASSLLRHYGADVRTAINGIEALHTLDDYNPHFIISDLAMPVMDGWEFIRRLKLERVTMSIPIIALTANASSGDRSRAIAAGCHNYLTKPLTPYTFIKDLLTLLIDIPELAIALQSSRE